MIPALVTLPIAAILALASLLALWVLTTNREVGRLRRRKILRLAARLRAELLKEIDRLEARNNVLRVRAAAHGPRRPGPTPSLVGPTLIEDLHATLLAEFRQRTDKAYQGIQFERARQLEGRCRTREEVTREVTLLAAEIDGRAAAWSHPTAGHLASKQPQPRFVQAA